MKLNTDKLMQELLKEFKKVDEFRNQFKIEFIEIFRSLWSEIYQLNEPEQLNEVLNIMAEQTISFTESVIEKDRSYPEYRKEEELKAMDHILAKYQLHESEEIKVNQIKRTLNETILNHYPGIYEFSSFGYRFLDRNVQFYTYQFWADFKQLTNKKE